VARLSESILEDLAVDELEERVVEYVVREVGNGRRLSEALHDPYVRNRLNEEKLLRILEKPEVIAALERSISSAFEHKDFGFNG
jgi:hypothetical protein